MRNRTTASVRSNSTTNSGNTNSNNSGNMHGRGSYDLEGGRRSGRGRGGGAGAGDANASILEQQNNERINELSENVARLKGLTIDIGNEVREQNALLDNMGDGFQNTRDMLQSSLRRIGTMMESGGAKHMCYMVAFCVFVMIFLWWLMSYSGTSGA
jgi:blocked early in transport 1